MAQHRRALADNDVSALETLAREAGYGVQFDLMSTNLMRAPQLRHVLRDGDQAVESVLDLVALYHCMPDEQKMRGEFLSSLFDTFKINIAEDSPRTDWNARYQTHFTLLRESESGTAFADCWTPKRGRGTAAVQLVTGVFDPKRYFPSFPPYANTDEETRRVLHLAQLRQAAPPYSSSQILSGPTPGLIAKRVFMDAGAGLMGLMFGTMSSVIAEGHPSRLAMGLFGAGFVLSAEALQYHVTSLAFGNSYFRSKGARYGPEAVDALVSRIPAR